MEKRAFAGVWGGDPKCPSAEKVHWWAEYITYKKCDYSLDELFPASLDLAQEVCMDCTTRGFCSATLHLCVSCYATRLKQHKIPAAKAAHYTSVSDAAHAASAVKNADTVWGTRRVQLGYALAQRLLANVQRRACGVAALPAMFWLKRVPDPVTFDSWDDEEWNECTRGLIALASKGVVRVNVVDDMVYESAEEALAARTDASTVTALVYNPLRRLWCPTD